MNVFKKLLLIAGLASFVMTGAAAFAQDANEAPDTLIKRISQDVIQTAKNDKDIQGGNQQRIMELVQQKILPYVDAERMTQLAAGRFWREATAEQKKALTEQFRDLLIYTYSGALSQVRDQKVNFKPLRMQPGDTETVVRSEVIPPRGGEPIQISYRMEKTPTGWKVYDVNVLGAWLVETYKNTFATEIQKSGVDGLIKMLSDKNKQLASSSGKSK